MLLALPMLKVVRNLANVVEFLCQARDLGKHAQNLGSLVDWSKEWVSRIRPAIEDFGILPIFPRDWLDNICQLGVASLKRISSHLNPHVLPEVS